ncbi:MAG: hypothetical protein ACM359_12960 [Bacillota bacterium]
MANTITKLSQLAEDRMNLNTGTQAGAEMLDRSLDEVGYARSLVMSADGVILCGNQTHKASMRRGDGEKKPIIVETDGDVPVIVKRKDVTSGSPKAVKIAAYDNLANQRGLSWRPDAREVVEEVGVPVEEIGWTEQEIPLAGAGGIDGEMGGESGADSGTVGQAYQVVVECRDEQHQQEVFERMTREGFKCRVLTL